MSSSSSLTCGRLATWTIIAVLLQILGLLLFVLGFFPVKPALSGVSGMESYRDPMSSSREDQEQIKHLSQNQLRSLYKDMSKISPTFDRLILMFRLLMVFQQSLFWEGAINLQLKL